MEKWILAVGCEPEKFNETQKECLNYGVFIRMAASPSEAIGELAKWNEYLLVALFSDTPDFLASLKILRSLTKAPILVMRHQYDGVEKIAVIEVGAAVYASSALSLPDRAAGYSADCRGLCAVKRQYTSRPHSQRQGGRFNHYE